MFMQGKLPNQHVKLGHMVFKCVRSTIATMMNVVSKPIRDV